jgi:hypothetical protein
MNNGVKLRVALNGSERTVHCPQKIGAEACALLLVPKKSVVDVRGGCRADEYLHQARRLLMRR